MLIQDEVFAVCLQEYPSTWQRESHHNEQNLRKARLTVGSSKGPEQSAFGLTTATGLPPRGWWAMR